MKTKQWNISPGMALQKRSTAPYSEIPITRSGETSHFDIAFYGFIRLYLDSIKLYIRILKSKINGSNLYFHPFDHRLLFNYRYTLTARSK